MLETEQAAGRQTGSGQALRAAQLAAIVLILLLGMGLRLYGLDLNSLWRDELHTLQQSTRGDLAQLFEAMRLSVHPPGHNLIIRYLVLLEGDSEIALRLPSALAGVLSIALIYKIGDLLFSYRVGLFAAAFLAVLRVPIFYSQEARPYALLLCATLLATLFWIVLVKRLHQGRGPLFLVSLGYILSAIAASYTHYYGLYLIAWQGLGAFLLFIRRPKMLAGVILIYVPIVLAFLPWAPSAVYQFSRGPTWIRTPRSGALLDFFEFLFNDSLELLLIFAAFCLLLLVLTLLRFFRRRSGSRPGDFPLSPDLFLLLWLFLPIAGVYLMAITSVPTLTNKNLIICLPAALLLLARAVAQLPLPKQWPVVVAGALTLTFLLNLLFAVHYYSLPQKPQMREAVQYIRDHYQEYDNASIVGFRIGWYNYYFKKANSDLRVDFVLPGSEKDITRVQKFVEKEGVDYVWFLNAVYTGPGRALQTSFEENFIRIDHQEFYEAEVWLYKTK